jgi:hypothetical protein
MQEDWMSNMTNQFQEMMKATVSNMVSDQQRSGSGQYYANLPTYRPVQNSEINTPQNPEDLSDDEAIDIDSETQSALSAWLKAAKKVTINGSSRGVFTGSYWEVWKKEMTLTLKEADLYKFCRPNFKIPTESGSLLKLQYDQGAHLASRFIMKCVNLELAQEMAFMETAKEMWSHLVTTQESKTVNERNAMISSWESLRQGSHEKMAAYIRRLDLLAAQLNEKGRHKDEVDKLHKLLGGLSDNWSGERTSLEVCANFTPYPEMCAILQGIAVRRGELTGELILGGEAHSTFQGKRRPQERRQDRPRCMGCGDFSHSSSDCPKVKLTKNQYGYFNRVCWMCQQTDHIQKDCPKQRRGGAPSPPLPSPQA